MEKLRNINFKDLRLGRLKISVRLIAVLILAIGIGVFMLFYNGAKKINAENEVLRDTNAGLQDQQNHFQELYDNREEYRELTAKYTRENEIILAKFPSNMLIEDKIVFANNLKNGDFSGLGVNNMQYQKEMFVMDATYSDATLGLYKVPFNGRFENLTYNQAKQILSYVGSPTSHVVMDSFSMTFSPEDGLLDGNFTFRTFFVTGQPEKPYQFSGGAGIRTQMGVYNRSNDLMGTFNK